MHKTRVISVLFYDSNIVCVPTTSNSALPIPLLLNSVKKKKKVYNRKDLLCTNFCSDFYN